MTQVFINILSSAMIYLMISLSYSLIYYPTKFFHIAHAAVITSGAYFVFFFANTLLIPFPISVALAIFCSTLIGAFCETCIYRRMRKKNVLALGYLIASIGLYVIIQNLISIFFGDNSKTINTSEVTVGVQILGAYVTNVQLVTFFVSIILFTLVCLFLNFTKTGKSIRAVASNSFLCNIYGISSNKIILVAFALGSALAAITGILVAMDTKMTPVFGFNLLLYGVVAMIIGGVGSTRGLILGSLLVATAQNLAALIDPRWMDAVTYLILILFLIWKPLGFSGKKLQRIEI